MLSILYAISVIEDENDREFMEHIFLSYQRLMYHEIYKIAGNSWLTEDILQATIIKLIDHIETLRALSKTKRINYIITASKNTAYTQMRRNSRHSEISLDEWFELSETGSIDSNPESFVLYQEELSGLATAWDQLDSRSQYLLNGRYILNKSYSEMADELGIKPESVRMAVTRAKRAAYALLNDKNSE